MNTTTNKIAHGIVLAFFALATWFLWGLLRLSGAVRLDHAIPAYTRLCIGIGPQVLTSLVVVAGLYCGWVWIRKLESKNSWVAFLATTTGALVLVIVLVVLAAYLPLLDALNQLAHK
jgi:hypothetical protein